MEDLAGQVRASMDGTAWDYGLGVSMAQTRKVGERWTRVEKPIITRELHGQLRRYGRGGTLHMYVDQLMMTLVSTHCQSSQHLRTWTTTYGRVEPCGS